MEDGLIEFLHLQDCTTALYHSRRFKLLDAFPFFFVEEQVVHSCVFLHKDVGFALLVVKVRPLCSSCSANIVEEGVPDSESIIFQVQAVMS